MQRRRDGIAKHRFARSLYLTLLAMLLAYAADIAAQHANARVNITIAEYPNPIETTAWTVYGLGLGDWVNKTRIADTAPEGPYIPSFEAELHARQAQLGMWRELNAKRAYSLRYMDEMLKVESSGFLREYLWQHHRHPSWGPSPTDLRGREFSRWQSKNLVGHVPQTGARIVFGPPTKE